MAVNDREYRDLIAPTARCQAFLRELARARAARNLSQARIAAAMRTSQSAIARLETRGTDMKLSTVERYAAAMGMRIEYRLVPEPGASEVEPHAEAA